MGDALKDGFYVLLFLPGFIFVQTKDYHILRGPKGQLEKTLEIVLWSAAIWILACSLPVFWPFPAARTQTLQAVFHAIIVPTLNVPVWASVTNRDGVKFFWSVCGWTFLIANLWGYLRRKPIIDNLLRRFTKRDWYPSVSLRFFSENVGRIVAVQIEQGKYIGTLIAAPDTSDDPYILLTKVYLQATSSKEIEKLGTVEVMLLKVEEIVEISVYDKKHQTAKQNTSLVARFRIGSKSLSMKVWSRSQDAAKHVRRRILETANGKRNPARHRGRPENPRRKFMW